MAESSPRLSEPAAREDFLAAAGALLGPRGLTRDPDAMAPWLTDWRGRYTGAACALAAPRDTAELAALVRLCARHRVPIVPQGGNSGMVGGATPDASGTALLLSLRRMDAMHVDREAMTATCGAGVVLQTLHETAAAQGLRFPLTLGGKGSATVGGLIATNAGGTQVLRHGTMRARVAGLEAVLADGAVLDLTAALKKDNRGFDLKQLLIGSEGTLGIVARAVLTLVPAVADRRVVWAGLASPQAARALLLHCERAGGTLLEGFEVLPQPCLDHALACLPAPRAPLAGPHPWHALIEFAAARDEAEALGDRVEAILAEAFAQGLVEDATIAASEAQAEALWLIRESIPAAEKRRGPAAQNDISVPVARMPDFIDHAADQVTRAFPGHEVLCFGHLGDGNVHLHVIAPPGADAGRWEAQTAPRITDLVHDLVTGWHGSISAEHGIGQNKRAALERLGDPVALSVMRAVKRALDPLGLLNPGKLV